MITTFCPTKVPVADAGVMPGATNVDVPRTGKAGATGAAGVVAPVVACAVIVAGGAIGAGTFLLAADSGAIVDVSSSGSSPVIYERKESVEQPPNRSIAVNAIGREMRDTMP